MTCVRLVSSYWIDLSFGKRSLLLVAEKIWEKKRSLNLNFWLLSKCGKLLITIFSFGAPSMAF